MVFYLRIRLTALSTRLLDHGKKEERKEVNWREYFLDLLGFQFVAFEAMFGRVQ